MRGKRAKKRPIIPDPIYKSRMVTRLKNKIILDGKKETEEENVNKAIGSMSKEEKEALQIFDIAMTKLMPKLEVRSRRVGGATYQVPFPVKHDRSEALAVRWLVDAARNKKGKPMAERLSDELKHAYEDAGDAIKFRDDTHKMAEANRAFAHFKF